MAGREIRKIAVYGKAGIGKSTVSSNISAALSLMGEKVMQVGCDPKRDSIATLCGKLMPTLMDQVRDSKKMSEEVINDVTFEGFNGILGIECGGPKPGRGCAGKGVNLGLQLLEQFKIFEKRDITFVIFDVLGDVVCGGFSQPIRSGYAKEMYMVTCGEILTMYQANNIIQAVVRLYNAGVEVGVAGLINNMRGVPHEEEVVEEFARLIGVPVIQHIPRSKVVQDAEFQGKTVIETYPSSLQAKVYKELATKILEVKKTYIPKEVSMEELKDIISSFNGTLPPREDASTKSFK